MRILIFGAGVIGHIYGSQLEEAGHHVALYTRPGHENHFPHGLSLRLLDLRKERRDLLDVPHFSHDYSINYRPRYVESFSAADNWDLIIVTTTRTQLPSALPLIAANAGKADILFFQNNWTGLIEIAPYLAPDRCLFGFPEAGGAFDEQGIEGILHASVHLGEADGKPSPRLERIAQAFRLAGFDPKITSEILPWLWTHYAISAAIVAGSARAHSFTDFSRNGPIIKEALLAAREALNVVRVRGVDVSHMDEALPFDLPTWIGVPAFRFMMGRPLVQRVSDKHAQVAYEELIRIYREVVSTGHALGVKMPHLEAFKPDIDHMEIEAKRHAAHPATIPPAVRVEARA